MGKYCFTSFAKKQCVNCDKTEKLFRTREGDFVCFECRKLKKRKYDMTEYFAEKYKN